MIWTGQIKLNITKRGKSEHGTIHLPVSAKIQSGEYNLVILEKEDLDVDTGVSTNVSTSTSSQKLFKIFQKYVKKFEPLIEEEDIDSLDEIMEAFQ